MFLESCNGALHRGEPALNQYPGFFPIAAFDRDAERDVDQRAAQSVFDERRGTVRKQRRAVTRLVEIKAYAGAVDDRAFVAGDECGDSSSVSRFSKTTTRASRA
jgi:hypothetical protein